MVYYFQILVDTADYKLYPIGLQGSYKFKITNLSYNNNANASYVIELKSNVLQFDRGYPNKNLIFFHRNVKPNLLNPVCFNTQLQNWLDFTVVDYATQVAPVGFVNIILHCEAEEL